MARIRQNGEGSVYQRASDGRWIGSVTLGWDDGKRVRKTVSYLETLKPLEAGFGFLMLIVLKPHVLDFDLRM